MPYKILNYRYHLVVFFAPSCCLWLFLSAHTHTDLSDSGLCRTFVCLGCNCLPRSVLAGAGGQVDDEEDVELEEDGDSEEDGVDDEAGHAEGPAQHEPGGQQDDVEQHQAEDEGDDRVGQALGVHLDQPGVRGGAADNQSLKTHKQRKVDFSNN